MKRDARQLPDLLARLDRLRVVCVYGDDAETGRGVMRALTEAAAGSSDDPFRVRVCDGESREEVEQALASPSLGGGRSVVVVRRAGEKLLPAAQDVLERQDAPLLILDYPAATGRSRLRALVEASAEGCALACYADPDRARTALATALRALGVAATEEAVKLLAQRATDAGVAAAAAAELAALLLPAGSRLGVAEVHALFSATGSDGLEAGLMAALAGDGAALDRAVAAALAEGTGGIGTVRLLLLCCQRLRLLALRVAGGRSVAEAGRTLRPPLFFRHEQAVAAALRRHDAARIGKVAQALWRAERAAKATGVPQDAVCGLALLAAIEVPEADIGGAV